MIRRWVRWVFEKDPPGTPVFDPVHLGTVIVGCVAALGVLYWLLWSLLVFEGGLFTKVGPALTVLFTDKTPLDFGDEGIPGARGVFEGWTINLAALILTMTLVFGIGRILRLPAPHKKEKHR